MSAMQGQAASSGSGSGSDFDPRYAHVDDKKRKRMISNRESARRSRQRKAQQMEDLVAESSKLKAENAQLSQGISAAMQRYMEMESANNVLRAQKMELTERLQALESVLELKQANDFYFDFPEFADPMPAQWQEPWQLPCSVQPIMANADIFEF
ncbi:hypothetical protein Tsubulata_037509 [Turnera subulata]|uniref:BZIP domain-containing protein n=1 Tax=Turnera subulata TaxID=218843 RepID=A0A9Q0G676_9ROSI|nr:hypothetical protein Tsubulata_037509 [Turnera subulata]